MGAIRRSALKFYVSVFVGCCCAIGTRAEIVPPERLTTWQGQVGVRGGIPQRLTVYKTLGAAGKSPDASQIVTAADINTAIANCPAGQVVYLQPGTYNITDGTINLSYSNVTLRGAGPTQTRLVFSGVSGYAYITMGGQGFENPQFITNWSDGFGQNSTKLSVASTQGYAVGNLIAVDQINDPAYISSGDEGGNYTNDTAGGHLEMQLSEVTAVSGNSLTIKPGIYMANWAPSFNPRVMQYASSPLVNTGLEDLHIEGAAPNPAATHNIALVRGKNCWIKNIDGQYGNTSILTVRNSINCEIRDSYFRPNRALGVGSYSLLTQLCTRLLIENNVFDGGTSSVGALVVANSTCGSVVGYNFIRHTSNGNDTGSLFANHNPHPAFNLFEGNIAPQILFDSYHGSSSNSTVLRNYFKGTDDGTTGNAHAVQISKYNRYMNVIGNVLGTAALNASYEDLYGEDNATNDTSIFKIGRSNSNYSDGDAATVTTTVRHGNYDTVSRGQIWDPGIADHSIPNSYYLLAKPAFFGVLPWPAVDPARGLPVADEITPAGYRFVNGRAPDLARPSAPGNLHVIAP